MSDVRRVGAALFPQQEQSAGEIIQGTCECARMHPVSPRHPSGEVQERIGQHTGDGSKVGAPQLEGLSAMSLVHPVPS